MIEKTVLDDSDYLTVILVTKWHVAVISICSQKLAS
jgi:hypothetical protein